MKENKRSRSKLAALNVIFNTGYQVVNTVVNLIIPPLIISTFGSKVNGLIQTIKQIISYVQLIGAGIAESTVVSLYKPLSQKDDQKVSAIFNASAKSFWQAGIIFSVISVLVAFIYPFFSGGGIDKVFVGCMVLVLCVAGASEFFVIGKCRTLLQADQKIYIVNIAQIIGAIAMLVATVIMMKLGANVLVVQLIASCAYILRLIILYIYVKKNYRFLDKNVPLDRSATSRRKAATIHQLAGIIVFGSQTVVISKFVGYAEASVYSVYALIFTGINTLLSTLSSALLATFGDIIANESREKLTSTYDMYEFVYYFLIFSIYSAAFVMIIPFISIYTAGFDDANYLRPLTGALLCVMGVLNCIRTPGATLINAIGHYDETKNRAIIEMLICFITEIVLVLIWGMNGVIIGTILAFLYRSADIVFYSNRRILKRSIIPSCKRLLLCVFTSIIVILISQCIPIDVSGYFMWFVYGVFIFCLSIVLFSMMSFVFYRTEMKKIWIRVLGIVKRA